jgi:electron transfer flavoprotein alpha subunit
MLSSSYHSISRQARTCLRHTPPSVTSSSVLARLLSTLAILEKREGQLNNASLGAVTAGTKLGGSITGFIAGSNVKGVVEAAAKVKGIDKIIMVENGAYEKVHHGSYVS